MLYAVGHYCFIGFLLKVSFCWFGVAVATHSTILCEDAFKPGLFWIIRATSGNSSVANTPH